MMTLARAQLIAKRPGIAQQYHTSNLEFARCLLDYHGLVDEIAVIDQALGQRVPLCLLAMKEAA